MNGPRALPLAVLALLAGTADARDGLSSGCCDQTAGWTLRVERGAMWAKTEEIVVARPEYVADHLSYLTWEALVGIVGINVRYRTGGILRIGGGVWHLADARHASVVNLDYLDPGSAAVTHRSVSPADLVGVGWELSTEYLLAEETRGAVFVRSFARLGYRGNYHSWKAHGGAYEYPDRRGTFDDEELIRYLTIHQVFDLGVFVELGQAREGVYGRLGGVVALLALANDRDTHVLTDTDYYNTYRRGWYVRPEIAVGAGLGHGVAVEVVFEPSLQFGFGETGTKIRTARGVYVPEEKPDYRMALQRLGVRILWRVGAT